MASAGNPGHVTFWRSCAKPFQALPLEADGARERFGITSAELALCCASHSSEPRQVELVRGFLERIGCGERDLVCGPHAPLSSEVAKEYAARGVQLTSLHSNCSGKHTGMLALARHHGWPTREYEKPGHPVQQRCLTEVATWTGLARDAIGTGVDGCGVVCYALPIEKMAEAYAKLAGYGIRETGNGKQPALSGAKGETRSAGGEVVIGSMLAHPELLAGKGRPCTELMQAHPGKLVVKVGAAGLYSAALLDQGWGLALKVEDGDGRAATIALAAMLRELGYGGGTVERLARSEMRNTRGEAVGEMAIVGTLRREKDGERGTGDG